jgi:hypothetical protein
MNSLVLGDDGVAVVIRPVGQWTKRGELRILDYRGVVACTHQGAAALEFLEKTLVVDVEAEHPGGCVQVGAIDKDRDPAR